MIVRPATLEDVADLAPRLRASDRAEVAALSGAVPGVALQVAMERSVIALVLAEDRPEAMFGVIEPAGLGRAALVWAVGSDHLPRKRKLCIQVAKDFLAGVGQGYGRMTNLVHADNAPSIRLLRRLGFTVSGQPLAMPGGGQALTFWRNDRKEG